MSSPVLITVLTTVIACSEPPAEVSTEASALTSAFLASGDTYVTRGHDNKNQDTLDELVLRIRSNGNNRALIQFDTAAVAALVGAGHIESARLEITIASNQENWANGATIDVHALTKLWTETGATWNCAIDTNTANQQPDCAGATAWEMQVEGLQPWRPIPSDTLVITNTTTGVLAFDVTGDLVATLAGSQLSAGFIIKKTNEGHTGRLDLASRETATPPRLVVVFTPDTDSDGVLDPVDVCPTVADPSQLDTDGDHIGDACECAGVTCTALDACHGAGVCVPATGACTQPALPDGTSCDETCSGQGLCVCTGGAEVCTDPCGLPETPDMVGRWCFTEGTGTSITSTIAGAPPITGIVESDWTSHGLSPATSLMQIADDSAFDLGIRWRIDVAVEMTAPNQRGALVQRVLWGTGPGDADQWVRIEGGTTGASCETARNNANAFNMETSVGIPVGGIHVLSCERFADGTLHLFLDGVEMPTVAHGSPSTVLLGEDQPFDVGYSRCPAVSCPFGVPRFPGILHGLAIAAPGCLRLDVDARTHVQQLAGSTAQTLALAPGTHDLAVTGNARFSTGNEFPGVIARFHSANGPGLRLLPNGTTTSVDLASGLVYGFFMDAWGALTFADNSGADVVTSDTCSMTVNAVDDTFLLEAAPAAGLHVPPGDWRVHVEVDAQSNQGDAFGAVVLGLYPYDAPTVVNDGVDLPTFHSVGHGGSFGPDNVFARFFDTGAVSANTGGASIRICPLTPP